MRHVPKLSLQEFHTPELRAQFVADLYSGLQEFGFVVLKDHGIQSQDLETAYQQAQALFALPLETKLSYDTHSQGQRGYVAFGRESAKGNPHPDLKEFWHIGPDLAADSPYKQRYPENVWPSELPAFEACFKNLFSQLNQVAATILDALEVAMGIEAGYFRNLIQDGNSIQRLIHYPPLTGLDTGQSIRAAAHADINLMTLLVGATDAGLELLDKDGTWLPVESEEGEIVLDTGDMMARLTNDVLPATQHRVVNPKDTSTARYSIPFFVHPHNDAPLYALPELLQGDAPKFDPITAGDFLQERLKENGF